MPEERSAERGDQITLPAVRIAGLSYREASAADLDALARLRWESETERHAQDVVQGSLNREAFLDASVRSARDEMALGRYFAWLAVAEQGEPIACVVLQWWPVPPNLTRLERRRGFVTSVYTVPEYRRLGIARQLMALLLDRARELQLQRVILWASEIGRPLYDTLGFAPSRAMEINL